ncbi:MAG: hypothetical protein ACO25F_02410 [Erythrobacter sp.]
METGAKDRDGRAALAVRLSLFGPFQIRAADDSEILISNRRGKALLGILALSDGQAVERETLSRMLWPGRFDAHAKASLRQCLLDLRKLLEPLGAELVEATRSSVGLNHSTLRTDLRMLEQSLAAGACHEAAEMLQAIGTAPLLAGMDFGEPFNSWLAGQRATTERRLQDAIDHALAAVRQGESKNGRDTLLSAWSARNRNAHQQSVSPFADSRTRVAVLPFTALDVAEGEDYFADGMVDELITTLGQVPQLLVAGRTSSFHFRSSALPGPAIAEALRVEYLVEGSIQRQGEAVRVYVHLLDGASGFELWAQRYNGTLDAIFQLQENVAQAVTRALAEALELELASPQVRTLTNSKAAYDLYLQAKALSFRLFGDGMLETAVSLLDQALEIDPDFAEAWLLQAEVHQLIAIYTACLDRPAASARMAACVERALAINPKLGQAYSLLGLHQMIQNDFVGALDLAFEGYRIEPAHPQVAMRLGSYLMFCGRTEQGMRYIEEALALDPIDGRKFMLRGTGNLNQGNLAAALADYRRSVDLGFPSVYLALATAVAGEHEGAVDLYMQTRLLLNKSIFPPAGTQPMTPEVMDAYWLVAAKGVCSGKSEDREAYCRTLDYLHLTMYDNGDYAITLPTVFMGYTEMLYKTLGERISPGNMGCMASIWADIDPIRQIWQDPEFIPFAQRIGMAAAWEKYGWPDLLPPPDNLPKPV